LRDQRVEQLRGHAGRPEPADHDRGAVCDVLDGCGNGCHDLVDPERFSTRSQNLRTSIVQVNRAIRSERALEKPRDMDGFAPAPVADLVPAAETVSGDRH
jgi:hypothetical protein